MLVGQVAKLLGCSSATVRRRYANDLPSVVDEQGRTRFAPGPVEELRAKLGRPGAAIPTVSQPDAYTAADAGTVFRLLRDGKSLVDVTLETGLDPRAVRAIADEYARHSGALLFTSEDVASLERAVEECGVGELPLTAERLRETLGLLAKRAKALETEIAKTRQRPAPPAGSRKPKMGISRSAPAPIQQPVAAQEMSEADKAIAAVYIASTSVAGGSTSS